MINIFYAYTWINPELLRILRIKQPVLYTKLVLTDK